MRYIITESQNELLSELNRNWMERDYEESYNNIKDRLIPLFVSMFDSYDENDKYIRVNNSDGELILVYNKLSGEIFYNRNLDELYYKLFPHPIWLVHGKFIMSDVFEQLFPNHEVFSVKSANM